jgi:hypothetical protein
METKLRVFTEMEPEKMQLQKLSPWEGAMVF